MRGLSGWGGGRDPSARMPQTSQVAELDEEFHNAHGAGYGHP